MKFDIQNPPRVFEPMEGIKLKDMGNISLEPNEQVSLTDEEGMTNDIVRKEWGYYITNSLNDNLARKGFKTALVMSQVTQPARSYITLVEAKRIDSFLAYLKDYKMVLVAWLDEFFPN